ncbi:MAG: HAD-IIB family hydrolase [Eubacterium sp.]|nr:HAD-IIB family hydrolase [Eubacterium sp.]
MKLYVTDLDGTLLDHKAEISIFTRDMLNREIHNGVNITFATARSIASAAPIVSGVDFTLPIITHNGVFIIDPKTKERLISHFFSDNSKEILKSYFTEHEESLLVTSFIDGKERQSWLDSRINAGTRNYIKQRQSDIRLRECKTLDELFEGDIFYVTLIGPKQSPAELDEVFYNKNGFTRNYQADTYDLKEYWYEIYRDDVSKANAIIELSNLLGADEVITFGDNLNDIPMLKEADRGYAVSNALDELKAMATGVIRSNNQGGVPIFISNDNCTVWEYQRQPQDAEPDTEKFSRCLAAYVPDDEGIGTLNEKQIHSVLKSYFASTLYDKEVKIGSYFADLITENGIFEIQTQQFKNLVKKLDCFLQVSHVTVVYPFHKTTRLNYVNKGSGELMKTSRKTVHKNITDFFIELYRIKQYLNNPNLTICVAELTVDYYRFTQKDMKRRRTDRKLTVPTALTGLIYLEDSDSYKRFMPEELPQIFTRKELAKILKNCETSIFIEIMKDVGLIDFAGKNGNEYIYKRTDGESI